MYYCHYVLIILHFFINDIYKVHLTRNSRGSNLLLRRQMFDKKPVIL